jgi:hypothetical protein
MLALHSVYRDTCHTGRPLKLSTQVLVLEFTLLTSMPALLSVYRLQIAVCTVHSENWYVVLCAAQCALYTECNVQQPDYLHCTLCRNWCIITVQCAATSVCAVCCVQQLVHCALYSVQQPGPPLWWVLPLLAGQSESHTGPLISPAHSVCSCF